MPSMNNKFNAEQLAATATVEVDGSSLASAEAGMKEKEDRWNQIRNGGDLEETAKARKEMLVFDGTLAQIEYLAQHGYDTGGASRPENALLEAVYNAGEIPTNLANKIIEVLINKGLVDGRTVLPLDKFPKGSIAAELGIKIILKGQLDVVERNLDVFDDTDGRVSERVLLEDPNFVADNVEKFTIRNPKLLVDTLVQRGLGNKVVDNIAKFPGVNRMDVIDQMRNLKK